MRLDIGVEVGLIEVETLPVLREGDRLGARQVVETRLPALSPSEIIESAVEVEPARRLRGALPLLGQAFDDEPDGDRPHSYEDWPPLEVSPRRKTRERRAVHGDKGAGTGQAQSYTRSR